MLMHVLRGTRHFLPRRPLATTGQSYLAVLLHSSRPLSSSSTGTNPSTSTEKKRPLSYMFRQFKLAGAHPDILWSIDAAKAQHNGEEMAKLETLLHERLRKGRSGMASAGPQRFQFWLKDSAASTSAASLRRVECLLHPAAEAPQLHRQLGALFQAAGLHDDFALGEQDVEMSVESLLHYADQQQNTHIKDAGALYIRAEKAIEQLRQHGVVVVVTDGDFSYLVTLPEAGFHHLVDNRPPAAQQYATNLAGGKQKLVPMKSIVGPNGEVDPDAQEYMRERGLRPFELRMSGSQSAIESFVSAFERLERLYEIHRGRALRPGVCLVLRLQPPPPSMGRERQPQPHYIARDGCLVLSMRHMQSWEEFLLSRNQDEWSYAVEQHRQWRIGAAPKLEQQRRQLKKLADAFGFFWLRLQGPMGAVPRQGAKSTAAAPSSTWHDTEETLAALLREEPVIRKTLAKYKVYSKTLQKRGTMVIVPRLFSRRHGGEPNNAGGSVEGSEGGGEEIGYRLLGDGTVYFSRHKMTTPQMLRVLRDNIKRIEQYQTSYDRSTATLEHLSRVLPIDFSIDTQWKIQEESRFPVCLEKFVKTMQTHQHQIKALLHTVGQQSRRNGVKSPQEELKAQLEYEAGAPLPSYAHSNPLHKALERRYVWVISDKLDAMSTGVLFIPYNVDFASLERCLLPAGST
eukprot:gene7489-5276_t